MPHQIIRLFAQGAAGSAGQHNEGNHPSSGEPAADAFGGFGQRMVREEL